MSIRLFNSNGNWVTRDTLLAALDKIRAYDCKVLYMHTGLSFGALNSDVRRVDMLQSLYEIIRELKVPTLCVPTFTFSFCNGDDFDVQRSRSRMGALNEHIRNRPEAVRSSDPLMSVSLVGEDRDLVENLGHESIGKDSTFDKLSRRDGVKFLFFGVNLGDCFTYMHYLEWVARVPYRYNREFFGKVTNNGSSRDERYTLFVRYNNVIPNNASYTYGQILLDRGDLLRVDVGDSTISCVDEKPARELYLDLLREDPNYFIQAPFDASSADPTFIARDMVAL